MIPYMVGKLGLNSSHLTRGLVKYVSGRGYFRAVSSQTGGKLSHPRPPPIVKRVDRPLTTQIKCTALVIVSMIKFPDAVDERVFDVLVVGSASLEPFCQKVAMCPFWLFPLSSPQF